MTKELVIKCDSCNKKVDRYNYIELTKLRKDYDGDSSIENRHYCNEWCLVSYHRMYIRKDK